MGVYDDDSSSEHQLDAMLPELSAYDDEILHQRAINDGSALPGDNERYSSRRRTESYCHSDDQHRTGADSGEESECKSVRPRTRVTQGSSQMASHQRGWRTVTDTSKLSVENALELVATPRQNGHCNTSKITPLSEYEHAYNQHNSGPSSSGSPHSSSDSTQDPSSDKDVDNDQEGGSHTSSVTPDSPVYNDSPSSSDSNKRKKSSSSSDSGFNVGNKKAKSVTKADIDRALSMGLTQERAAEHFSVSLSTFKRRLRALHFKWPRGKKQRERMGVGEFSSGKKSSSSTNRTAAASRHVISTASRKRKRNILAENRSSGLNSRLEKVIQGCHELTFTSTRVLRSSSKLESTMDSSPSASTPRQLHQHASFFSSPSPLSEQEMQILHNPNSSKIQNLVHLCQLLQQRNATLAQRVSERQRFVEHMQRRLHQVTTRSMDIVYRGDVQGLRGPWNTNRRLSAVTILDPYLRLIASNTAWQKMVGFEERELSLVGGFCTFHNVWPQMVEYSTALKVLQPLLKQKKVKRIHSTGVFKTKAGNHICVRSIFHVAESYFWEELELIEDLEPNYTFESEDEQHVVSRDITKLDRARSTEHDYLVETFLGFTTFARGVHSTTQGASADDVSDIRPMSLMPI
eukprot:CAMPEP_0117444218 /NCGR_PEP_ID=MMETSP0759-20121206/5119_1 /TAXON_ID=63605 /ORGANISM="Percolomonas cosmopolitus, Strain WS" /LENGTH=630 /DNA_ID=CAMNT_0005236261 /DNA_START=1082 /DNA_END=2974 /DNA_ORIENTATION=+